MTVGATSPSLSSSVSSSALVDSASPGKNELDSFSSAALNFPGRSAATQATMAAIQTTKTTHFERGPAERANTLVNTRQAPRRVLLKVVRGIGSTVSAGVEVTGPDAGEEAGHRVHGSGQALSRGHARLAARRRPHPAARDSLSARGGTRTRTSVRTRLFESRESAIPPP